MNKTRKLEITQTTEKGMFLEVRPLMSCCVSSSQFDKVVHSRDYFDLIWISSGNGLIVVDGEEFKILENTIYAALPGDSRKIFPDAAIEGWVISISRKWLFCIRSEFLPIDYTNLYNFFSHQRTLEVDDTVSDSINSILCQLQRHVTSRLLLNNEITEKYLELFLLYLKDPISRKCDIDISNKEKNLFCAYLICLEEFFKSEKTVAGYAKMVQVNAKRLNQIIKKFTGICANQHIRQRLIAESKIKMKYTGASIKQIASELGFADVQHFSKFFKARSGLKPSNYRQAYCS